jgi:hypothetical protein
MLSRVLAGDDPHRPLAGRRAADGDEVEVTPLDGGTEVAHRGEGRHLDAAQQVEVTLVGIRLEVGVVDAVALGPVLDDQLAVS